MVGDVGFCAEKNSHMAERKDHRTTKMKMRQLLLASVLISCVLPARTPGQRMPSRQNPPPPPPIKVQDVVTVSTNLIQIDATVVDKHGDIFPGLTARSKTLSSDLLTSRCNQETSSESSAQAAASVFFSNSLRISECSMPPLSAFAGVLTGLAAWACFAPGRSF